MIGQSLTPSRLKLYNNRMVWRFTTFLLLLITLSACQEPVPSPQLTVPSQPPTPVASPTPISIRPLEPTTVPGPAGPSSPYPAPQSSIGTPQSAIPNKQSGTYHPLFSISVGPDGVRYQGVGSPDAQITGPDALVVLPDRNFIVADLLDNRLLRYDPSGKRLEAFELSSLDVVNVSDLAAHGADLYLLEVSSNTSPVRCRVNRLSAVGDSGWKLAQRYEIPPGVCTEGGLSGIFVDGAGRLLVEVAGGSQVYLLADTAQEMSGTAEPTRSRSPTSLELADGYSYFGQIYRVQNGQPGVNPRYQAGEVTVQTALSHGLGGFRFLDAFSDGHSYLIRNDVVDDQAVRVDQTVSDIGPDGIQQRVARFPVAESLYYIYRNLAVGPDGSVYGLLPREKTLDVIRLDFLPNLPPLIPTAAEPVISVVTLP
jgi:hypothetical protein